MTHVLLDPIATHASARPKALALVDLATDRRWTYSQLDEAVSRTANWLVSQYGPASGERIATLAKNCADMIILQHACVRAGAIFVPLNWRLSPAEIEILLNDAEPVLLLADAEFGVAKWGGERIDLHELEFIASKQAATAPENARRDFSDVGTLLYTSGTSGRPKGVMVSEENAFWGSTNYILGNSVTNDSVFLCDMPLFHTAGLYATARTPILAGGTLLVSPGFDAELTLARIADRKLKITHYFAVPQMAQMLWNQPDFEPAMLRRLKVFSTGGAPNPPAQIHRFAQARIPMADGFGMSETCSNFGMPPKDWKIMKDKAGSCGLPFLTIEARVVDANGCDAPDGEPGELWLRGPSVTKGYWNQPERTKEAFEGDWFKTGDAAIRDEDGYYFIVDRKKDMFISGGENVYPAEVEAAIAELPVVAEVAVIGLPDDKWGEVGRAYVVPVGDAIVTPDDILEHCLSRLAKYKIPKSVIVGEDIPRTASGKVQKHILRARALEAEHA